MTGYATNLLNILSDSPVFIFSFSGSSFECFFSFTNIAIIAKINGNIEVILKMTLLSSSYNNLPEE